MDQLGRADDARVILEQLIRDGKTDSVALNTYINIMVRCGFVDEAISAAERILERTSEVDQKRECIRLLFTLEQTANPASDRLLDFATLMGTLVDREIESQEGLYLMMMLTGTMSRCSPPSPSQIQEFQDRSNSFFSKFPNSHIIKRVEFEKDATPEQLFASIQELVGGDEEATKIQAKLESQLQAGTVPFPYAWRPQHILRHVRDVVQLWEITKRSGADDRKYHLQMMDENWKPKSAELTKNATPILDLISLLVVWDLGLLDHLFSYFRMIAISKGTLLEIATLTQPIAGSVWSSKCKALQDQLKVHSAQILQPGSESYGVDQPSLSETGEEIKRLYSTDEFVLYSDDLVFRIYCGAGEANRDGICTGDLLNGLEETGVLTTAEVADKLATLCSWHVGLMIDFKHQVAIIPDSVRNVRSVREGVGLLQATIPFMSMATAIWDFRSDFVSKIGNVGGILKGMIENSGLQAMSIASLFGIWYVKSKLRSDVPMAPPVLLTRLIIQSAATNPAMDNEAVRRLWSVYLALVEFEHGDRMDEQKEREAIELLARQCAEVEMYAQPDKVVNVTSRLTLGLTPETANADQFARASTTAKIELGLKKTQQPK